MGFCFPATKERAATSRLGWAAARVLGGEQARELRARLEADAEALDVHRCHQIARDLDLPYQLARPAGQSACALDGKS